MKDPLSTYFQSIVQLNAGDRWLLTENETISLPGSRLLSLHSTALWCPSVPGQNLHLNEEFLFGAYRCTVAYEPLIWAQLGDRNGADIQHLTEPSEFLRGSGH